MKDQLRDYLGRPKRYDNIDGTGEMSMGLMLIGFALAGFLPRILPEDSMWRHGFLSMVEMYLILIPVWALIYWGGKALKQHVTWPRTGYAVLPRSGKNWWTKLVVLGAISATAAVGFTCLRVLNVRNGGLDLARLGIITIWVPLYAFWLFRMGREHPWKWLVLIVMAMGLLVIDLVVPGDYAVLAPHVISFVGLTWLLSGVATLYLYLRHTQPAADGAEDKGC